MAVNVVGDLDPEPYSPLVDADEISSPAFFRGIVAEFVATLLFLYVTVCAVIGNAHQHSVSVCGGIGTLGVAFAFGGTIFVLVYCTAGISGGHINPAITIAFALARKITLPRAILYIVAQCLGGICGAGIAKAYQRDYYDSLGGAANSVQPGYSLGTGFAAEMIGTFVLIYTVFVATDPHRRQLDAHVPALAPFSIGFAIFIVHLATIPITGTGINPARSLATAVMFGHQVTWHEQWIFWLGPIVGALLATIYYLAGVKRYSWR